MSRDSQISLSTSPSAAHLGEPIVPLKSCLSFPSKILFFLVTTHCHRHRSICRLTSKSIASPSHLQQYPQILQFLHLKQRYVSNPEWAFPFPNEKYSLLLWGPNSHPGHFTFFCKPQQCESGVIPKPRKNRINLTPALLRDAFKRHKATYYGLMPEVAAGVMQG